MNDVAMKTRRDDLHARDEDPVRLVNDRVRCRRRVGCVARRHRSPTHMISRIPPRNPGRRPRRSRHPRPPERRVYKPPPIVKRRPAPSVIRAPHPAVTRVNPTSVRTVRSPAVSNARPPNPPVLGRVVPRAVRRERRVKRLNRNGTLRRGGRCLRLAFNRWRCFGVVGVCSGLRCGLGMRIGELLERLRRRLIRWRYRLGRLLNVERFVFFGLQSRFARIRRCLALDRGRTSVGRTARTIPIIRARANTRPQKGKPYSEGHHRHFFHHFTRFPQPNTNVLVTALHQSSFGAKPCA